MPPSAQQHTTKPLSARRVWVTRAALLIHAAVVVFAVVRLSWIWLGLAAGIILNLAVQPPLHLRQILGRRVERHS